MEAECKDQLHGHDFPFPGGNCQRCGVNQRELSGLKPKNPTDTMSGILASRFKIPAKKVRGMHSEMHALVSEVRRTFGEDAKKGKGSFGFYLGFFNRLGIERVRMFLAETRDGNNPKVLFWWRVGKYFKDKKSERK